MSTFYSLLTAAGQAKLTNAMQTGTAVRLTHMALGDGNGAAVTPSEGRTALVREVYRAQLNSLSVHPENANWLIAELVVPPNVGGWTIRECGLFDEAGILIAHGNFPESYKPVLDEGSGKELVIRMYLETTAASAVTLQIDPSVVLATRSWVLEQISRALVFPGGTTGQLIRKKSSADGDWEWWSLSVSWSQIADPPAFATRWPSWSEVTGKPATFAPSAHTHSLDDLLQTAATPGQVVGWDGTKWKPMNVATGTTPTNLSVSRDASSVTVNSDTGADAAIPAATASLAGVMTAADKSKLDGIAAGATSTPLANTNPAALGGTASPGTSSSAARADHVHPYPTPAQIGAATASHTHSQYLDVNAGGTVNASVTVNGAVRSQGGGSALYFHDRTSNRQWAWWAENDTALLWNGSGSVVSVTPSGAMNAASFDTGSSERLKTDLEPLPYGLAEVERIDVRAGRYRPEYVADGRRRLFLIAEQLRDVLPEVVREEAVRFGDERLPAVDYMQMIPVLVRAVQELSARVRELEARG